MVSDHKVTTGAGALLWSLVDQLPNSVAFRLHYILDRAAWSLASLRLRANTALATYEPMELVFGTLIALTSLLVCLSLLEKLLDSIHQHGLRNGVIRLLFELLKRVPGVRGYIEAEKKKVLAKLSKSVKEGQQAKRLQELPLQRRPPTDVIKMLKDIKSRDGKWQGRCSGTVYMGGENYEQYAALVTSAYAMFAHTNPLHPDVFPSGVNMEAEVVAMTAGLLGGTAPASGGEVCGHMTTGGTESILMAVKSARDYMRAQRGITKPELIMAESAHAAYDKACHYFGIKLRRTAVDKDLRADVAAIRRLINSNTIMIVASAPGYPHGVLDPVLELGRLAQHRGICLHVDCCLGGFILPFARKLGYDIPPFDFEVPGVTSISCDLHKYGLAPKGASVVLYRNHQLRRHQYIAVTEWTGGLYVSPSVTGSRTGGLIAAAWAAMVANGMEGYMEAAKRVMQASQAVQEGIARIPGLYIQGKPAMTVVAFGAREMDIYKVNDVMSSKGWILNALQKPAGVHICLTLQHVECVRQFLTDLEEAANVVRADPESHNEGMAPIYGAAAKMPDRGTVEDLLIAYQDSVF